MIILPAPQAFIPSLSFLSHDIDLIGIDIFTDLGQKHSWTFLEQLRIFCRELYPFHKTLLVIWQGNQTLHQDRQQLFKVLELFTDREHKGLALRLDIGILQQRQYQIFVISFFLSTHLTKEHISEQPHPMRILSIHTTLGPVILIKLFFHLGPIIILVISINQNRRIQLEVHVLDWEYQAVGLVLVNGPECQRDFALFDVQTDLRPGL